MSTPAIIAYYIEWSFVCTVISIFNAFSVLAEITLHMDCSKNYLESLKPCAVIWCLHCCMCVLEFPALRPAYVGAGHC